MEQVADNPNSLVQNHLAEWMREDSGTSPEISEGYGKYVARKWIFIIGCIVATFFIIGAGLSLGTYEMSLIDTYTTIWNHIIGDIQNSTWDEVIFKLRMPRIVLGIFAGAGLAVAGACMQSTLNNPLADPFTTGVSAGASLGATLAIVAGFTIGGFGLIGNAFIFALIPTSIMVAISRMKNASPTMMIMAGIAIMYLFSAVTTILKLWSNPDDLKALYMWEVGSLGIGGWDDIKIMAPVVTVCCIAVQMLSRQLNVMAAGDDNAKALGVNASQLRSICMVIVALMAATIVSFTGMIGFVGLVCPHVVRIIIGRTTDTWSRRAPFSEWHCCWPRT